MPGVVLGEGRGQGRTIGGGADIGMMVNDMSFQINKSGLLPNLQNNLPKARGSIKSGGKVREDEESAAELLVSNDAGERDDGNDAGTDTSRTTTSSRRSRPLNVKDLYDYFYPKQVQVFIRI